MYLYTLCDIRVIVWIAISDRGGAHQGFWCCSAVEGGPWLAVAAEAVAELKRAGHGDWACRR